MRPWLVIIEVNMTEPELNTECTGEVMTKGSLTSDIPTVLRSSALPLVGGVQQIMRLWRQVTSSIRKHYFIVKLRLRLRLSDSDQSLG